MNSHKSGFLFLMELLFSILFFAITAMICVQLFVQTQELEKETIILNQSIGLSQNLAEILEGSNGNFSILQEFYPLLTKTEKQNYYLYWTEDFHAVEENSPQICYKTQITSTTDGSFTDVIIRTLNTNSNHEIYMLEIRIYNP